MTRRRSDYCGLAVELHDSEPTLADEGEDIVEVSFDAPAEGVAVYRWGDASIPFELPPGRYRLRYAATGMDPDDEVDVAADDIDGGPPLDRYLMQFWPEDSWRADGIVRTTCDRAAYWHRSHGGAVTSAGLRFCLHW